MHQNVARNLLKLIKLILTCIFSNDGSDEKEWEKVAHFGRQSSPLSNFFEKIRYESKQGVCKKLKLIPLYEEEKVISENFKSVFWSWNGRLIVTKTLPCGPSTTQLHHENGVSTKTCFNNAKKSILKITWKITTTWSRLSLMHTFLYYLQLPKITQIN